MTPAERISQAGKSLEDAQVLAREELGNKLVLTKLYHAMMESLFALFDIRDMGRLTHADVIGRFEQQYVKTGRIERQVLDVLHRAYDLTHECDCDHMPVPTDEEVRTVMKTAKKLIHATDELLKNDGKYIMLR